MLHILWLILKVILILLGIVIGLILLGALLLLFCQIPRKGKKGTDRRDQRDRGFWRDKLVVSRDFCQSILAGRKP